MKSILIILVSIYPLMGYAQVNCMNTESADASYHRYAQLAMEPIMENGELVGYLLKETTKIQKAEALECLKASVRLGGWKAARTLANLYEVGVEELNIQKSEELSKEYERKYRELWRAQ
ncbi:MAG: hypothetical protein ABW148_16975 [Sedimenticola sp.]